MKFLTSQMMAVLQQRDLRKNLKAFYRYVLVLIGTIVAYSLTFHALMVYEGQEHSWLTGFYWTLTVMTTLGFGDITFHTDLGRAFSILVLLTGVVLLLIVLPFTFIRNFYAPWLEAQLRFRAPRELPEDERDHVILCEYDSIAQALILRLDVRQIPYVVLEPDPTRAVALHGDGVRVLVGEPESVDTWRNARAEHARLVVANLSDPGNTNVTLTMREHAPDTLLTAVAEDPNAVDILQMAGATHVVALKERLGQQLAVRVNAGALCAHVVGRYEDLLIAELPLRGTALAGRTVRDTRLRELCGVNIVAYWDRGRLRPARPDAVLEESSVAVVVGTEDQIDELNAMFVIYQANDNSVIVIGGGKVGRSVIQALKERGIDVTVVEEDEGLRSKLEGLADKVVIGDASNFDVMRQAEIGKAPSVVLTTHDDAANIFLTVYCRRLNPKSHIVSRVTHERNLEAIHRAGADFVLSESGLAAKLLISVLQNRELVLIGEAVEFFVVPVPPCLAGKTLMESGIGAKTGMNVIAIRRGDQSESSPAASSVLAEEASLVLLGTVEQRLEFTRAFSGGKLGKPAAGV